ncbi:glycosyltransferase family 4 protein [Herbiconiux sp. P17]|uniref:glycosyltransferase family 4 protein n=1 Tax=Herbiconiux wuyangfengii TaxID=3342794 RepID=UPI0035BACBE9
MAALTVEAFVNAGMSVVVVLPGDGPLVELLEAAGAEVEILDIPVLRKALLKPGPFLKLILGMPRTLARSMKLIRSRRIDTVVVNTITQPWWIASAKLARRKSVTHVREAENNVNKAVQIALVSPVSFSTMIICNSNATRDHVIRNTVGARRKTRVVYNGKDWAPYFRSEFAGISPSPRILFVGRLNPRKGPDTAIAALAKLRGSGIDAHLTLAGSVFPGYEWYEQELRDQAKDLGVSQACEFVGFVSDTAPFLDDCDISIVPSLVEPFGTVAAESMAAMRPTIVSNVQGLVEIVDSPTVGLVFEAGDADELAGRIRQLVDDAEMAESLARNGRESVLRRFSITKYGLEMVESVSGVGNRSRSSMKDATLHVSDVA